MASFHPTAIHSYVNYITLQDREDAGRQLAQRLSQYKGTLHHLTRVPATSSAQPVLSLQAGTTR
jgi:hypothetical protein